MEALSIFLVVVFLGTLVYFLVKDPLSFMFFVLFLFVLGFILYHFKVIRFKNVENFGESTAPGAASGPQSSSPFSALEVFYVSDNTFTYDEAESVCKAYGAQLATYDDVEKAYRDGGEWCGYGWSAGGMALFPTQQDSWKKLQESGDPEKAKSCGRVGINGGYFDKKMKFGVNCYGKKPAMKPGSMEKAKTDENVEKIKKMLGTLVVDPFDKLRWSEYDKSGGSIVSSQPDLSSASVTSPTTLQSGKLPTNITSTAPNMTSVGAPDATNQVNSGKIGETLNDYVSKLSGGLPNTAPGGIPSTGVASTSAGGVGGSVNGPSPSSLSTSTTNTDAVPAGTSLLSALSAPTTTTTTISKAAVKAAAAPVAATKSKTVGEDIGDFFTDLFGTIDGWLTGEGKKSIEDVGMSFLTGLDEFFTKIGSMLTDGFDTIKSDFSDIGDTAKSTDYKGEATGYLDRFDNFMTGKGFKKTEPAPVTAPTTAPAGTSSEKFTGISF